MDTAMLASSVATNNTAAIEASAAMTQSNMERELSVAADTGEYNAAKGVADLVSQQTQ
ncbi:MAG: hypothetical protein L3K52_07400 [Candidatus Thiothrix sulfatifontis]|nr:MAG: hypothetical protein L3K52_07400 [Candidatus Thiothrix sulfatifontis]